MKRKEWKETALDIVSTIAVCSLLIMPLAGFCFASTTTQASDVVTKVKAADYCKPVAISMEETKEVVTCSIETEIASKPKEEELVVVTLDERSTFFESDTGYKIANVPIDEVKTTTWKEVDEIVYEVVCDMKYLDPATAYAFMKVESSFQSDAFSCADCVGLMQLFPKYQVDRMEKVGATNLFVPEDNIKTGCSLLNDLLRDYDLELAVKVYGWGAENADKEQYQEAMQKYIDKVYLYQEEWRTYYADDYEKFLESRKSE